MFDFLILSQSVLSKSPKTTANANAPATAIVATTATAKKRAKTTANANAPARAIITAIAMVIAIIMAILATTATANAQFEPYVNTIERFEAGSPPAPGETNPPASTTVTAGDMMAWRITLNRGTVTSTTTNTDGRVEPRDFQVFRLSQAECNTDTVVGTSTIVGLGSLASPNTASPITVTNAAQARLFDVVATVPTTTTGFADGDCFRLGFTEGTGFRIQSLDGDDILLGMGDRARHVRTSSDGTTFSVTDQIYTFTPPDTTAPTVTSVSRVTSDTNTADPGQSLMPGTGDRVLRWRVTFSEEVEQFETGDLIIYDRNASAVGAANDVTIAVVAGTTPPNSVYNVSTTVTVTDTDLVFPANPNTYSLRVGRDSHGIQDPAGNALEYSNGNTVGGLASGLISSGESGDIYAAAAGPPVPAPTVSSVVRSSSASADTMGGNVTWTVTFSDDVMGVDDGDFEAFNQSGATMLEIATTVTMTSASVYEVTAALPASGYSTAHTVGLRLARATADHMIQATGSGNTAYAADNDDPLLSANYGSATNQTYTLTTPAGPTFSFVGLERVTTDDDTARFRLAVPGNIDLMDLVIADFVCSDGTTSFNPTVDTMTRTATNIEILCTHGVAIGSTAMITAGLAATLSTTPTNFVLADVAFPGGTGTSGTTRMYAITPADRTAPNVDTIVGGTPNHAARSVEWTVTFSEVVMNVDSSSFVAMMGTTTLSASYTDFMQDATNGAIWTFTTTFTSIDVNSMAMVILTERDASSGGAADAAGNLHEASMPATMSAAVSFLDQTAPMLMSVSRSDAFTLGVANPTPTTAGVSWIVTFSEPVTGVLPAHFEFHREGAMFETGVMSHANVPPTVLTAEAITTGGASAGWRVTLSALPDSDSLGSGVDQNDAVNLGISFASGANAIMDTATMANAFVVPADPIITTSDSQRISYSTAAPPVEVVTAVIATAVESSARNYVVASPRLSFRLSRTDSFSSNSANNRNRFTMNTSNENNTIRNDVFYSGVFGLDELFTDDVMIQSTEIWIQGTYSSSEDSVMNTESSAQFIHTGIDVALSDDLIVGGMFQYDTSEETTPATTSSPFDSEFEGTGWLFSPYLVSRFGYDNFVFEGRIGFGGADNELTQVNGRFTNTFETSRFYASVSLSGDPHTNFGYWSLNPRFEFTRYTEDYDAYMDSANRMVPAGSYSLGRLSVGPTLSRTYYLSPVSTLSPSFSFTGQHDSIKTNMNMDRVDSGDFSGKFDVGLSYDSYYGMSMNLGGYYDGVGSDTKSFGLTGGLKFNF